MDYVRNNFNRYIKDSTLPESILDEHPVPEIIAEVYPKRLNEFIKDTLSEQNTTRDAETDKILENIQQIFANITGPLSRIWMGVDSMKDGNSFHVDFHGLGI